MTAAHRSIIGKRIGMLLCLLAGAGPAPLHAGTVAEMNLPALADHAGQVIVGRVASMQSYWADHPRRIETEIVFDQVEFLKGALESRSSFTLVVPGGTVGRMNMRLSCAPTFAMGEKWLLFVLPTYRTFPIVGLHRGAFQIEADAGGVERVLSPAGQAISAIDDRGFVVAAGEHDSRPHQHPVDSINVRLRDDHGPNTAAEAMRYDEFLAQLHPVLAASRDHQLTEPAGKRVFVEYTPVPLTMSRAGPAAVRHPRSVPRPRRVDGAKLRPATHRIEELTE